jgi:hypothetical protein
MPGEPLGRTWWHTWHSGPRQDHLFHDIKVLGGRFNNLKKENVQQRFWSLLQVFNHHQKIISYNVIKNLSPQTLMWLEFCLRLALTKFAIFTVCPGHHGGSLKYSSHVKCRRQQFSELNFSCQSWRFFELPDLLHITMQSCTIWTGLYYWRMFFAGCAIWTQKKRERCVTQSEIHWAVEILKRNVCKKKTW